MLKPAAALAVLLLLGAPAMAQKAVTYQGGTAAPGDLLKLQGNGSITSAGDTLGDKNGKGVNPFSILDRGKDGLCLRTDAASAAHFAFCLGHDADGNALISVDSLGGKPPKDLKCRINGVLGTCFSASTGGGTETGALTLHGGSSVTLHSGATVTFHGS